jgi:hypothetical protein
MWDTLHLPPNVPPRRSVALGESAVAGNHIGSPHNITASFLPLYVENAGPAVSEPTPQTNKPGKTQALIGGRSPNMA